MSAEPQVHPGGDSNRGPLRNVPGLAHEVGLLGTSCIGEGIVTVSPGKRGPSTFACAAR
jgi:hypothetical protein